MRASRWGRRARWLSQLTLGLGVLHGSAYGAVAAAVALAPNALAFSAHQTPMPASLAQRGARAFRTNVGPPAATLATWLVEARSVSTKGTVILLHGVRSDKSSLAPVAAALSDAGYRAILVDLRGHGESSGRYLTYGQVETRDISALLDRLSSSGIELGCVGVYGFSYGGAVALELGAREPRVRSVVAVAAFSALRDVLTDYRRKYLPEPLELIPNSWFQSAVDGAASVADFDPDASAPIQAIRNSNARMLLIHGSSDTQVPIRHSQALLRAAGGRAKLLVLPGATHSSIPSDPSGVIRRELVAWFDASICASKP